MRLPRRGHRLAAFLLAMTGALLAGAGGTLLGLCGPFTDVTDPGFCPFVLEIFYLGITTGTSPTTYDPTSSVTRLQMAAFLSRTVDGVLRRGGPRAAADQFWTTQTGALALTTVSQKPSLLRSDGADVWVTSDFGNTVARIRASDGKLLETWTGATSGFGVVIAAGRVIVAGGPGLYAIDPSQPAGAVTTVASNLPVNADGIAFDGTRIFTANFGAPGSVSIAVPGATIPWTVTTVTAGFTHPFGATYDGTNVWVTDNSTSQIYRLDSSAAILQTVTVGSVPYLPAFDGTNIWVPNNGSGSISVVRASSGVVLQTLTGISGPVAAAFDGQRVLVTAGGSDAVFLYKAADLLFLGLASTGAGTGPYGACSDGQNFWIALGNVTVVARF